MVALMFLILFIFPGSLVDMLAFALIRDRDCVVSFVIIGHHADPGMLCRRVSRRAVIRSFLNFLLHILLMFC